MIDLEQTLSAFAERAPEPPALERIVRRAKQRQRRRRGVAFATTLVVLAAGLAGATAIVSSRRAPHVAGVVSKVEHVRLTLLDGSQLEISGPQSLGLTKLEPVFNGALDPISSDSENPLLIGHGFTITKNPPGSLGAVVGQYPTRDGHVLVVHANPAGPGTQAVTRYGNQWLYSDSGGGLEEWEGFAGALNVARTADGSFVVVPATGWRVGPTDAPDIALGGGLFGSGAAFGFYGPLAHACPTPQQATGRTPQGWPVMFGSGAWWCDGTAGVRIAVWDNRLVDAAIAGLRISFTSAADAVANVTTLEGSKFAITAPSSVLDHFITQATVAVDGLTTPTPIVINAERTDAAQHDGDAPHRVSGATFTSGDGHRLTVTRYPKGDDVLQGTYGDWTVQITVTDATTADRARIASLFAAHVTADGFLVLDPSAPMRFVNGPASDIVLKGVDIVDMHRRECSTESQNPSVRCDPEAHVEIEGFMTLLNHVHVRRVG